MPSTRVAYSQIESWSPAIDVRAVENGNLYVLEGRNFYFDSKGPKSGFGSTLVEPQPIDDSYGPCQSLRVGARTLFFTPKGCYERTDAAESQGERWRRLATFSDPDDFAMSTLAWTQAYVGFGSYVCHPRFGLFQVMATELKSFKPVGIEDTVLAVAESAGRLIIQGKYTTAYSNSDDAGDLTPELGGAGFQVTRQRVPGDPITVTTFQGGFVVWCTEGVLLAEFVGGDTVFRFDRVITKQFLSHAQGWCQLANGDTLILTTHGLFRSSPSQGLSPLNELFNEYLKDLFKNTNAMMSRVEYFQDYDLIFLSVMDESYQYYQTYVYSVAIEKWGLFSESHRGMIEISSKAGDFGYVDMDGYVHRFADVPFRENQDGTISGLDSEIVIGYLSPTQGAETADANFEVQEILISARESAVDTTGLIEEDWNGPDAFVSYNQGFYLHDEDWNNFGLDFYDVNFNDPSPDEDCALPGDSQDFSETIAGQRDFDWNDSGYLNEDWAATPPDGIDTSYIENWGYVADPWPDEYAEDWNGDGAFQNRVDYQIKMICNLDGFEGNLEVEPVRAIEKVASDLWTLYTHGHHHRMIISATQPWENYHVKTLSFTVHYAGQVV